jgi:hypothetical protein
LQSPGAKGKKLPAILLASVLFILGWVKVRKSLSPWPLLVGGLMYGVFIAYVLGALRR